MSEALTLNDVFSIPFDRRLQDLFFVFGDEVIDRAARCVESEVNEWVNHLGMLHTTGGYLWSLK